MRRPRKPVVQLRIPLDPSKASTLSWVPPACGPISGPGALAGDPSRAPARSLRKARPNVGHAELTLERHPQIQDRSLLEEPAPQRNALRHRKRPSGLVGLARRKLACTEGGRSAGAEVDEPGTQVQAWMSGEVAGEQHRPRHERADHRIDFGKRAVEREHDLVAEAVELDMVDGRKKPRFAEGVRPGSLVLPRQRIVDVAQGEAL